jgi:hypothetical protein
MATITVVVKSYADGVYALESAPKAPAQRGVGSPTSNQLEQSFSQRADEAFR